MREAGRHGELYIGLLDEEEVARYWPNIEEGLRNRPDLWTVTTIPQIKADIDAGKTQVWVASDEVLLRLVIFSELVILPNGTKELQMVLCMGQQLLRFWDLIVETFEDVAIKAGCPTLSVGTHRDGFVSLLKAKGYRVRQMQLVRTLGVPRGIRPN